jgi:hypothetical protein
MIAVVLDGSGEKFQQYSVPKDSRKWFWYKIENEFIDHEQPITINLIEDWIEGWEK